MTPRGIDGEADYCDPSPDFPIEMPTVRPNPSPVADPKIADEPGMPADLLIRTAAGKTRGEINGRFREMLGMSATIRGRRPRANALDVTDFEAAFDDLLNPSPRPRWLEVLLDVGVLIAGGFIGYAINILTGQSPDHDKVWLSLTAGGLIGVLSTTLKHIKL